MRTSRSAAARSVLAASVTLATLPACATAPPPLPRDAAGPCLQIRQRRTSAGAQATVWRGDQLVFNGWSGTNDMDEPLVQATADNPPAQAEAKAFHRAHLESRALVWTLAGAFAAFIAAPPVASDHPHFDGVRTAVTVGFLGWGAITMAGGSILDQWVAPRHRDRALEIYNAAAPADCAAASEAR
jgi:hypothetical protein